MVGERCCCFCCGAGDGGINSAGGVSGNAGVGVAAYGVDFDAVVDGVGGVSAVLDGAGVVDAASGRGTACVVRVWLVSVSVAVYCLGRLPV